MEKKMIPPSELCLPSDITLNAGRAARQVGNWSVCHTLPRSRHFSFQQPKGIRKQSEPMQAKRDFRSRNFEKVRWGTVLWTLVPRNCHQAYQMLTTKNKWMLAISLFHFRSEACLNHSSTMNSVALNYIVSLAFLSKIRRRLIIFFSGPSCLKGCIVLTREFGFGSIYPLDSSLHSLNWDLICVYVISCHTLK